MPEIQKDTDHHTNDQTPQGNRIYQVLSNLQPGQACEEKTQVRVGQVRIPKPPKDVEMPVCKGTVSQSVKDTQTQPGTRG